jgi:hypothetical protein
VRRLIVVALLGGCAQPGMPPGGPPDESPPDLVRVRPDSNQRNVRAGSITFEFDEVVSERPAGAPSLAELFIISPSEGVPAVSWRRTRIDVTPRGGLRPNTTYIVQMQRGIADLDGNADSVGRTIVFSTGADLASGSISGRVFDWVGARVAPQAYVEAVSLPDSLRYATTADSSGAFTLAFMTPGRYLLRAVLDLNRNRRPDGRELFDSVTVDLRDSVRREMLAALRDSLGPGVATVEARDSTRLRITVDRPLDTLYAVTPAAFTVVGADSTPYPIRAVLTQAEVDRMAADSARRKAVEDSVRAAERADSVRRADSARVAAAPAAPGRTGPTGRRPGAQVAPPPARADSAARPDFKPAARIPVTVLYLELERSLPPATAFRLRSRGLRSISGIERDAERQFTTPRPRRPDTTAVRPDSGGRSP